jgi:predicted RNase H-like nuclease (RuvC/YqgF family)
MDAKPYTKDERDDMVLHTPDTMDVDRWLATLDSYQDHIARLKHEVGEYTDKLSAAQAECAALREALDSLIRYAEGACHSANAIILRPGDSVQSLLKEIVDARDALSRTPGRLDALREVCGKVAQAVRHDDYARRMADETGIPYGDISDNTIIDRILGRAGSGGTT